MCVCLELVWGRHAVACFLTRGDLFISWEEGQKVFERLLLWMRKITTPNHGVP